MIKNYQISMSCPFSFSNSLYKNGQDFSDIHYRWTFWVYFETKNLIWYRIVIDQYQYKCKFCYMITLLMFYIVFQNQEMTTMSSMPDFCHLDDPDEIFYSDDESSDSEIFNVSAFLRWYLIFHSHSHKSVFFTGVL